MKKFTMWVAISLMMAAVTGCSSESNEVVEPRPNPIVSPEDNDSTLSNENNELKPIVLTRAEQQLVNSNNDFAFNLFRQINMTYGFNEPGGCVIPDGYDTQPLKSQIVSPISITYALGMLNNGAAGETLSEINNVLGFKEAGADGINDFCKKMLTEAPDLDKLTKVLIANNIYMNKDFELIPDFITKAKNFYDADVETRDFNDGQTRNVINKWGNDHTMGMIPEVLKEGEFNPSAVSYLLNAIYFKGTWTSKFDKAETKDEEFQSTETKQVPMMHQEKEFNYTENELCQALRLPYGNGAYSMTILLPKEGKTINDVISTLTAETWERYYRWVGSSAIVDVKLPRFETNFDIDLKPIMIELGMSRAFDDHLAEFPYFCNVPTYIGLMKQVAKIKLSEEGTEAAAITIIGVQANSMGDDPEPQHVNFHATRPFIYVISEQSTGAIFFIGKYMGD